MLLKTNARPVKPYPVMDMENFDTSNATYPRQILPSTDGGTARTPPLKSAVRSGKIIKKCFCICTEPNQLLNEFSPFFIKLHLTFYLLCITLTAAYKVNHLAPIVF